MNLPRQTVCYFLVFLVATAIATPCALGQSKGKSKYDPIKVSRQIDQEIQKKLDAEKVKGSSSADDAEFLRRVFLDVTGKLPPPDKVASFIDSKDTDKRRKVIDELLANPDYGQHFGLIWRNMIVKRDDNNKQLNSLPLIRWMANQFNKNPGWDKTVYALLTADGNTQKNAAGIYFFANRDMTTAAPSKVVASTSQLFLGVQMECAECHDHPFYKEWKQTDFWGMAAFFSRVKTEGGGTPKQVAKNPPIVSELDKDDPKAKAKGASIAIPSASDPEKTIGVAKAKFFEGEEPKLGDKGPYRPAFATWVTSPKNKYFSSAMVNRLWAHFFARGLFHPVEDYNEQNPPSHPELLKLLSKEFVDTGFDVKHIIRCICNSKAYQRTSEPLPENEEAKPEFFSRMTVKVMAPDVLYDALIQALEVPDLKAQTPPPDPKGNVPDISTVKPRNQFVRFFESAGDNEADGGSLTESGHGIPQFLRLMNSPDLNDGGKIVPRLLVSGKNDKIIEGLFLATLSRRPTSDELKKVSAYVAKHKDAKQGYAGVLWVLLNSAEFVCVR